MQQKNSDTDFLTVYVIREKMKREKMKRENEKLDEDF